MPVTVIGSGTLLPSAARRSASHLLQREGLTALLDVGPGAVHGLAAHALPWWDVSHVFLSHFHTDHIGDLAHLLFAMKWALPSPRSKPLEILGPHGLLGRADALAEAHGDFVFDPGFPVTYRELHWGETWAHPYLDVSAAVFPTPHTEHSMGYRFEGAGWSFGYTGDTGPSTEVALALSGTDVLICECGYADPPPGDYHLTPTGVAELAQLARPGTLVITHVYPPLTPYEAVELIHEAGYDGTVVAAEDGQRFLLPDESAEDESVDQTA